MGRGALGVVSTVRLLTCLAALGLASTAVVMLPSSAGAEPKTVAGPAPSDADDEAPPRPWGGDGAEEPPLADAGRDAVQREELPQNLIDKTETHVDRDDLTPIGAAEGAPFGASAWATPTAKELEALVSKAPTPEHSWALSRIWVRLLEAEPAIGDDAVLLAARVRELENMGLFEQALKLLDKTPSASTADRARLEISAGRTKQGCDLLASDRVAIKNLPPKAQVEAALLAGFCAALRGDMTEAGLAAGIARDLGGGSAPDLLDSIAAGEAPKLAKGQKLDVLDYRIIELKGGVDAAAILNAASPPLLVALARSDTSSDDLRLPAAERAARLNLIPAADLAAAYRLPHPGGTADTIERAALYKRIEAELTPLKKARLIRAFADEAYRQDMHVAGYLLMMAPISVLTPSPELNWFAETAIKASLLSGRFDVARRWADTFAATETQKNAGSIALWRALIEITEPRAPGAPRDVSALASLAGSGALTTDLMGRLSTVLDALDIGMPQALWDARSNLAATTGGHLPDTGTLTALKLASENREIAHTVLLAITAVGPNGIEGAHLLALGDCLRALKRADLDAEARLVALEALIPVWPRVTLE